MKLLTSVALVALGIETALRATSGPIGPWWHVAAALLAMDVGVAAALVLVARQQLRRRPAAPRRGDNVTAAAPALSVLIAAFDEATVIAQTVASVAAQRGVSLEILVGDDGSTDGTSRVLCQTYALTAVAAGEWAGTIPAPHGAPSFPVRLLKLPHRGKGATLNALAARASRPVLVTLDADTVPTPGALAAMARAFVDPAVDSAAGMVAVRNGRTNWLLRHQAIEYARTSVVRIGWSALGGLEQVPGAFTGVRAASFRAAGGFPEDSLTEDYELTYRLVRERARTGRPPVVVTVPEAQVLTDGPATLAGFIGQRTRWFAGFLTTLARFRELLFEPRAGVFGLVRLPLKLWDALAPLLTVATFVAIADRGAWAPSAFSRPALTLLGIRWTWDLLFHAAASRISAALGDPGATPEVHVPAGQAWLCAGTETFSYFWLRQLAMLRAYVWTARKLRRWEHSRVRGA